MSEYEFWRDIYAGFRQIAAGIGVIMAAIAKRHVIGGRGGPTQSATPPPTFSG